MSSAEEASKRPSFFARFSEEHARVFFFSLGKLWVNPLGTLLTAAVIGITLALPASLHVLVKNAAVVSASWESTLRASLFLKSGISKERGESLTSELQSRPGIAQAQYVSREQSLAEFRELSGFGEALDLLADNPLPAVIVIAPKREMDKQQVSKLVEDLATLPEVDQAKLDQKWLERLYALLDIASRIVWMIASLLGLAVIVIVGNTIRLDIENRREEIVVMKLIGAPDGFIRRPFLYTGFWYGLMGSVIALVFVFGALLAIRGPAQLLSSLYNSSYSLSGLSFSATLLMFAAGIFLGWFGAFWIVTRHLGQIEPQ